MSDRSWIPLMDYAVKKGLSMSTLRRYIKANKVQYRIENGRYLLWDDEAGSPICFAPMPTQTQLPAETTRMSQLEGDLQKAHEEIAELKMLIALYEEKIAPRPQLDQ